MIGKIVHSQAKGVTSVDPNLAEPVTPDTLMWIASCTKLFATIAALQAVERGQLELDADVTSVIPEVAALQILTGFDETGAPQLKKPTNTLTLRHLLTQQSGMAYDFIDDDLTTWRKWMKQEFLDWEWPIVTRSFSFFASEQCQLAQKGSIVLI